MGTVTSPRNDDLIGTRAVPFQRNSVADAFRSVCLFQYRGAGRSIRKQIYHAELLISPVAGKTHAAPNGRVITTRASHTRIKTDKHTVTFAL